jgi:lysophospholipase L1-like esterase
VRSSLASRSFLRGALVAVLVAVASGCSLGMLLSVPWVRHADRNDVVVIGDSIWALSGDIQRDLEAAAGETFRNYAVSGAQLIGGSLAPPIPDQYETARADDPNIGVLMMDGGGNDILIPAVAFDPYDCLTQWYQFGHLSKRCKSFIDDIYVAGVDKLNDFAADGVQHVIYLGYYHPKNGLLWVDDLEEATDYGDGRLAQACQFSAVQCTFVDPRSTIRDSDILVDGVHPTAGGSQKLANLIWPVLHSEL